MEIVEQVEFFTTIQCRQEMQRKCHTSYVTRSVEEELIDVNLSEPVCRYMTQEVERCEEEYNKQCSIIYQPEARNVSRTVCSRQSLTGKFLS